MSILSNFATEDLRIFVKLRNVNSYENMSRQQLKNTFTIPSSILTPTTIFRPRPRLAISFPPTPIPQPRHTPEPLPVDEDELEKMEMVKTRLIQQILCITGKVGRSAMLQSP